MSREIKFRAWLKPRWDDDEDANKMYYDVQNSYDTLGDVKPYDLMDSFDQWLNDDVAIVEQYTGLKDKNGKEIYVGDIVKVGHLRPRFEVTYNIACTKFWMQNNELVEEFENWNEETGIEVIGNIHENPELLEDK